MYNVLKKLRAGQPIEGRERETYQQGLVAILKDLHDRIDAATAEAYGWPADLPEEEVLARLVALNRERAAEEARGHIRWLRPDYQNPEGRETRKEAQADLALAETPGIAAKDPLPKALPEQVAAIRAALVELGEATPETVARRFKRARAGTVEPLLEALAALGHARRLDGGRFTARG